MAGGASGYDAFISYSHTLDGALAQALQTGLERFAKPWYRPRALRVFRDTTNLAANPGLWSSIEKALASSVWLVLMASPDVAQSQWVDREVAWWPLTGHTDLVKSVAFCPGGRTLATASGDKTVTLWDMARLEELQRDAVQEACIRAGGPLDKATWDFYAPGVSYQDTCAGHR